MSTQSDLSLVERQKRSGLWLRPATVVWYLLVGFGSVVPSWKSRVPSHGQLHFPEHFIVYSISAFLTLAISPRGGRAVYGLAPIALALTTEGLQCYVYRIAFEWSDLFVDIYAVLSGALLFMAVAYLKTLRPRSEDCS